MVKEGTDFEIIFKICADCDFNTSGLFLLLLNGNSIWHQFDKKVKIENIYSFPKTVFANYSLYFVYFV